MHKTCTSANLNFSKLPHPAPEDMLAHLQRLIHSFGVKQGDSNMAVGRGKQRAATSVDGIDEGDPGQVIPELAHLIDHKHTMDKRKEEGGREFWNSVMPDPLFTPRNVYSKAIPHHPYLPDGLKRRDGQLPELDNRPISVYCPKGYKRYLGKGRVTNPGGKAHKSDEESEHREKHIQQISRTNGKIEHKKKDSKLDGFDFTGHFTHSITPEPSNPSPKPANSQEHHFTNDEDMYTRINRPTDDSGKLTYICHYKDGRKEVDLPESPDEAFIEPETAHREEEQQVGGPRSETTLTWSLALNQILASEYVDPAMKDAIQQRMNETTLGDVGGGGRFASPADLGLVPNFSYPIAASAFYDRHAAMLIEDNEAEAGPDTTTLALDHGVSIDHAPRTSFRHDNHRSRTASPQADATTLPNGTIHGHELTNGISRTPSPRPGPHSKPSGLPTAGEIEGFRLLSRSSPSISPETQLKCHEGTIATQSKLIHKLHTMIDNLRERNNDLEDRLVPQLAEWLEKQGVDLDKQWAVIEGLKDEVVDLKIALDFGNKVLGTCWVREWELWRCLSEMRDRHRRIKGGLLSKLLMTSRKRHREDEELRQGNLPDGYEWEVFGQGPDPSGSQGVVEHLRDGEPRRGMTLRVEGSSSEDMGRQTSLSRTEMDVLVAIAEQNLKIFKEDIEEMIKLVQGCKRDCTGIQDIGDDIAAPAGTWRDV